MPSGSVCMLYLTSVCDLWFLSINGLKLNEADVTLLRLPFYKIWIYVEQLCHTCLTQGRVVQRRFTVTYGIRTLDACSLTIAPCVGFKPSVLSGQHMKALSGYTTARFKNVELYKLFLIWQIISFHRNHIMNKSNAYFLPLYLQIIEFTLSYLIFRKPWNALFSRLQIFVKITYHSMTSW